jgi:hypothetical protein
MADTNNTYARIDDIMKRRAANARAEPDATGGSVALSVGNSTTGSVVIDMGTSVRQLVMSPQQAIALANTIIAKAKDIVKGHRKPPGRHTAKK